MKLSLDQTTDYSHKELYSFLNDIALPAFVKSAELDDSDSVSALEKDAFADQYNKAFPIHNPSSAYVSNVYFFNKKAALAKLWGKNYADTVEERIKKASEIHNIANEVADYNKLAEARNNKDYAVKYLYTLKYAGYEYPLFPVKTPEDFKKQAAAFEKSYQSLPFDDRRACADSFVKNASAFGVDELPDIIAKYAGMFYPEKTQVENELSRRAGWIKNSAQKAVYAEIQEKATKASTNEDYFAIAKEAMCAEGLDGIGFTKAGSQLGDIVERLFSLSIDKVAELLDVVDVHGQRFHMRDLQKVASSVYKEAFGVELDPKNAEELRDVLPTMPLSDLALFTELSGLKPL